MSESEPERKPPALPSDYRNADRGTFDRFSNEADLWFATLATSTSAIDCLRRTREFLYANTYRMVAGRIPAERARDGRPAKPARATLKRDDKLRWFRNQKFAYTKDAADIEARRDFLRVHASCQGLAFFLNEMIEAGLIDRSFFQFIDEATNLAPNMIHQRMMLARLSGARYLSYNLTKMLPAFLYGTDRDPNVVRNEEGIMMIGLGLWTAKDHGRETRLTPGIVARLFHFNAYLPVVFKYDEVLASTNPSENGFLPPQLKPPIRI